MDLTKLQRRMLALHLAAPDAEITARRMAIALFGPTGHGAANLHYGRLARQLAEAVQLRLPDNHDAVALLVRFDHPEGEERHWVIRPTLAYALGRFGLVPDEASLTTCTGLA
jgi:hypothetical protein